MLLTFLSLVILIRVSQSQVVNALDVTNVFLVVHLLSILSTQQGQIQTVAVAVLWQRQGTDLPCALKT